MTRTMGGASLTRQYLLVPWRPHPHPPWALQPGPWQSVQGPNSVETGLLTSTRPSSPLFPGTLVTHSLGNSLASLGL